jgi:3-oxoacyl-[acyl-carrier protein] reductase
MSDFLGSLAANPGARRILGAVGVPLPARLLRDSGPWRARELEDETVIVGFGPGATLAGPIADTLATAGATALLVGDAFRDRFAAAGEAWGRPPGSAPEVEVKTASGVRSGGENGSQERVRALVFDASGVAGPDDLAALHRFFQPRLRSLGKSGRVVVLGRPHAAAADVAQAAARRALEGFVRSLAKELGKYGSTAQLLTVEEGAEDRVAAPLRFLLSRRSAYVSGQPWRISARVAASAAPKWTRPLDGKVALVTGAARGIGEATAMALAREGARVIVLDLPRDEAPGSEVAANAKGVFLPCDLAGPGAAEQVAAFVRERFGRLDIVVHNAGITRDKTLANMATDVWDVTLAVNLAAVLRLQAALDPLMGEGGRVVCLSSIAGIAGNVGQTNYAASKAGIVGLVESLAVALAPRGIAVNAIAPGFIETRLTAAIPVATREVARRLANLAQGGLPEDIAEVAVFLASPGASGLSGQVLRVCGGNFIGA